MTIQAEPSAGAHLLPGVRAVMRPRCRGRGAAHHVPAPRCRAPGDQGLRLPQGHRHPRHPPRPGPPGPPDAPGSRRVLERAVLGRRDRRGRRPARPRSSERHGPGAVSCTPATRSRSTPSASPPPVRCQRARHPPSVLARHPGLRQQVHGQPGRVRHLAGAPDPRHRPHRPGPHRRRATPGSRRAASSRQRTWPRSCERQRARGARVVFVNPRRIEAPSAARRDGARSGPTPTSTSSPRCCTRSTASAAGTTASSAATAAASRGCASSSRRYRRRHAPRRSPASTRRRAARPGREPGATPRRVAPMRPPG